MRQGPQRRARDGRNERGSQEARVVAAEPALALDQAALDECTRRYAGELRALVQREVSLSPLAAAQAQDSTAAVRDLDPDRQSPSKHEEAWLRVCREGWDQFALTPGNGCLATARSFTGGAAPTIEEEPTDADMG